MPFLPASSQGLFLLVKVSSISPLQLLSLPSQRVSSGRQTPRGRARPRRAGRSADAVVADAVAVVAALLAAPRRCRSRRPSRWRPGSSPSRRAGAVPRAGVGAELRHARVRRVDLAVAVVVQAVADLGAGRRALVLAAVSRLSWSDPAQLADRDGARARSHLAMAWGMAQARAAAAVARVVLLVEAVVDRAVAVVVLAVADLGAGAHLAGADDVAVGAAGHAQLALALALAGLDVAARAASYSRPSWPRSPRRSCRCSCCRRRRTGRWSPAATAGTCTRSRRCRPC